MNNCIWLSDEYTAICVNDAAPCCADACPALNCQEICKYYEPKEDKQNAQG